MCEKWSEEKKNFFNEVLEKYSGSIGKMASIYHAKNPHIKYTELFMVGTTALYYEFDKIHFDWPEGMISNYIKLIVRRYILEYITIHIPAGITIDNDDAPFEPVGNLPNPEDVLFEDIIKTEKKDEVVIRKRDKQFMKECIFIDPILTPGEQKAVILVYGYDIMKKDAAKIMDVVASRITQLLFGQNDTRGALRKLFDCVITKRMALNLEGI